MKKIYLSLASLVVCGAAFGQNAFQVTKRSNAGHEIATPRQIKSNTAQAKAAGGPGHLVRGVLADQMISVNSYNQGTDYNVYANVIFCDSTVNSSDNSGSSPVFNMKAGATFDPVSDYWGGGTKIMTSADAYTVDSLWIGGRYKRVNHNIVDTLVVEFAWGPATSSTVWTALSISSVTPALSFTAPKTTSTTAHGNKSFLAAPAANYKRIKFPLTDADTNWVSGDGYVIIPNVNQLVPAGNIFAAAYTFVPGQTVAPGSIAYAYTGGAAQNTNGFVGTLVSDPSTNANYKFYDPTSKSLGYDLIPKQRYGMYTTQAFFNTCMIPNTEGSWDIGFSVSYVSTVGVKELENKGFSLGQNVPNPFNGQSTVTYNIEKEASSAVFTVTDVMGRVISTEKADASKGTHTITLGNHSAGVYYYSLNVDGNVTTKKMIAQ
eukprot:TRINITY_DN34216_c0_g1_i1.p1 TRINITY_DN34216_c0_g1~~TRINITY_DN34216_c0_g1_i1.p1  ORF type:complete len:433 (+),score=39.23 TRINITY_DN34216_c0_g1_i1:18-1316(+)